MKSVLFRDLSSFFFTPGPGWKGPRYLSKLAKYKHRQLVLGQLAAIVSSNAPLREGLETAALDAPSSKIENVFLALRDHIAGGLSLSQAMRRLPRFFTPTDADLVQAGEAGGTLAECLRGLVEDLGHAVEFRTRMLAYLCYLGIIAYVELMIFLFLSLWLAEFGGLVREYGQSPPPMLKFVVDVGVFVYGPLALQPAYPSESLVSRRARPFQVLPKLIGPLLVVGLCIVIPTTVILIWGKLRKTRSPFLRSVGVLALAIPFVRGIFTRMNLSHSARVLAKLLRAGAPLDEALESISALDVNPLYAVTFSRLRDAVRRGGTLGEAMEPYANRLPAGFRGLVAVGESSGQLPEALDQVAVLYRRQARKTMRVLADVISPVVLIALACGVLVLELAVFQSLITIIHGQIEAF